MSGDQKRVLEEFARACERGADEHHPTCGAAKLMRSVGDAARGALAAATGGNGPAQVATPAFRAGWDTLFGKKQPVGQA